MHVPYQPTPGHWLRATVSHCFVTVNRSNQVTWSVVIMTVAKSSGFTMSVSRSAGHPGLISGIVQTVGSYHSSSEEGKPFLSELIVFVIRQYLINTLTASCFWG